MGRPRGRLIFFGEPVRYSVADGITLGAQTPSFQGKLAHTQLTHACSRPHTNTLYSYRIDTVQEKC